MPDPTYSYQWDSLRKKFKYVHRLLWTSLYGPIPKGHVVHHINGDPKDNRLSNLLCMAPGAHTRLHYGNYKTVKGQLYRWCRECKRFMPVTKFYKESNQTGWRQRCKPCHNAFTTAYKKRRLKEAV